FVPLEASAALRLAPSDASGALAATLAWRGLELAYLQGEQHVTLSGAADLGDLLTPYLPEAVSDFQAVIDDADLTWSPRDGFGGEITASLNTPLLGEYGVSEPVIVTGSAAASAPPDPAAEGFPAPLVLSTAVSARPGEPPGPT